MNTAAALLMDKDKGRNHSSLIAALLPAHMHLSLPPGERGKGGAGVGVSPEESQVPILSIDLSPKHMHPTQRRGGGERVNPLYIPQNHPQLTFFPKQCPPPAVLDSHPLRNICTIPRGAFHQQRQIPPCALVTGVQFLNFGTGKEGNLHEICRGTCDAAIHAAHHQAHDNAVPSGPSPRSEKEDTNFA